MPKFRHLLFGFALIFVGSLIFMFIYISKNEETLSKEAKMYVDNVIPVILKDLKPETFMKFASSDLIEAAGKKRIEEVFSVYSKLGEFKKYLGSKGKAKKTLPLRGKSVIYGKYTAWAKFSTGDAEIKVVVVKKGEAWFIYSFRINSKVFEKEKK